MNPLRRARTLVVVENPSDLSVAANEYGDEDESLLSYWEAAETVALVVPGSSTEDEAMRDTRATTWTVVFGPSIDVRGTSRLRFEWVEGEEIVARVVGDPILHRGLSRGDSFKTCTAEQVEG